MNSAALVHTTLRGWTSDVITDRLDRVPGTHSPKRKCDRWMNRWRSREVEIYQKELERIRDMMILYRFWTNRSVGLLFMSGVAVRY